MIPNHFSGNSDKNGYDYVATTVLPKTPLMAGPPLTPQRQRHKTQSFEQRRPMLTLGVALGIGWLIGHLLASTSEHTAHPKEPTS